MKEAVKILVAQGFSEAYIQSTIYAGWNWDCSIQEIAKAIKKEMGI